MLPCLVLWWIIRHASGQVQRQTSGVWWRWYNLISDFCDLVIDLQTPVMPVYSRTWWELPCDYGQWICLFMDKHINTTRIEFWWMFYFSFCLIATEATWLVRFIKRFIKLPVNQKYLQFYRQHNEGLIRLWRGDITRSRGVCVLIQGVLLQKSIRASEDEQNMIECVS